jgi:ribosome-binding protein aMBF1 (putative translation factor)
MGKLSVPTMASEIRKEDLKDEWIRAEHNRTALAHAVALRVLTYRIEHSLSQTALAHQLEMQQPAVARLEAGEHIPTFATLEKLARGLGVEFHIEITPRPFSVMRSGM